MRQTARLLLLAIVLVAACAAPPTSRERSATPQPTPRPTAVAVATQPPVAPPEPTPQAVTPVRAIGLSYADLRARHDDLAALGTELRGRGVNMIGLNVGRLDWTYFPWPEHEERWASDVRATGDDYVREAAAMFGAWGHVAAIVDVFVGRYLEARPEAAAQDPSGERSDFQVSTTELVEGQFGAELLELIDYVAATYPVDSIALTELFYDRYGYGDDDRAAYMAFTGQDDWPRDDEGSIDTDHSSISAWRVEALSTFVARAAAITRSHGKELFVDVRVSWDDLANEGRESGQDYGRFLQHADRLILWNYFGLSDYGPEYTEAIIGAVEQYGEQRIIISVGLWARDDETVSAEALELALRTIEASSIPHSWVTPSHLLGDQHWEVLGDLWARG